MLIQLLLTLFFKSREVLCFQEITRDYVEDFKGTTADQLSRHCKKVKHIKSIAI